MSTLSFDNLNNHTKLYVREAADQYRLATSDEILATARHVADELVANRIICDHPEKNKLFLIAKLAGIGHEVAAFMFLDSRYRLIQYKELFHGTINQASVYPREVVKTALRLNASAVILAHNHPSGDPAESQADVELTKHIKKSLQLVDIKLLDHIVVGASQTVSFAEKGLI
ncbi:RadC family protein [Advenella alkanexedens]|uniref:RadC family protein n=1 Tax=Advenella alkanexedens TaxID=1481665 RepID=UPI000AB882AB|nr:DNA repair protein RadC [Advenella alkanexedens]WKU18752.1 DNA repair protein RadC [Advenella alkanexedens]HAH56722.1 DNA repair protein RadC [Bacteroidales bacterium]